MKKILIYTVRDGRFVDSLYKSYGDGLRALGRDVIFCPVDDPGFATNLERIIGNEDIDFSLGHNEFGIIHARRLEFLKEFYRTKEHVAVLDDAPYNTVTEKLFEVECPNLLLAYRDRSHLDYLRSITLKHEVLEYFFLPFGALMDKKYNLPRDIDVIFSGMYYGEPDRTWRTAKIDKPLRALLDLAATLLENEPICVDEAISRIIRECQLKIDKRMLYPAYTALYQHCKIHRRNRLVETVANSGIRLTVCSDSWKKSRVADMLGYELARNTREVLDLYKRSKILLQDMAEFNDGSHCRIGDGTLCGAMLVSEHSKYLEENFNSSGIFFFQWNNLPNLPKSLATLLGNDRLRNSFINSAREKVDHKFLPRHGAERILAAVSSAREKRRGN